MSDEWETSDWQYVGNPICRILEPDGKRAEKMAKKIDEGGDPQ
ncbi:MAG: hypothetical protein ACYSUV_08450 [Planctomycetota bacterium]|jgi:hypothetical protein